MATVSPESMLAVFGWIRVVSAAKSVLAPDAASLPITVSSPPPVFSSFSFADAMAAAWVS